MEMIESAIDIIVRHKYCSIKTVVENLIHDGYKFDTTAFEKDIVRIAQDQDACIGMIGDGGQRVFVNPDVVYSREWFASYGTSGSPIERVGCHLNRLLLEKSWNCPLRDAPGRLDADYLLDNLGKNGKSGVVMTVSGLPPLFQEFREHYSRICPAKCETPEYITGLEMLQEGATNDAWKEFYAAAQTECAQAEYQLGMMILNARIESQGDMFETLPLVRDARSQGGEYLMKSANHGYPVAQYGVGCEYLEAAGRNRSAHDENIRKGMEYFATAAKGIGDFLTGCDPEAERVAAEMYYHGRGFEKNVDVAIEFIKSAVRNGSQRAKALLKDWQV